MNPVISRNLAGNPKHTPFRLGLVVLVSALWTAPCILAQVVPTVGFFFGQDYVQFLTMVLPDTSQGTFWEGWAAGFAPGQVAQTYVVTPAPNTVTLQPDPQGAWLKAGFKTIALRRSHFDLPSAPARLTLPPGFLAARNRMTVYSCVSARWKPEA
jgi:hypothetical protein